MSTGNYPKYTDEFKKSIVTLHQNGKSLTQLSKEYGISMSALSRWVRLFSEVKIDEDTVVTAQQIKELQKRTPAFRFATAFGKAGIIIMDISRLARAALAYHFMLAVAAYEFSRKYVVEDLFFTAGCIFVFFIDRVHLIP